MELLKGVALQIRQIATVVAVVAVVAVQLHKPKRSIPKMKRGPKLDSGSNAPRISVVVVPNRIALGEILREIGAAAKLNHPNHMLRNVTVKNLVVWNVCFLVL